VSRAARHLVVHLGGALAAVVLACGVPALAAALLGRHWPWLLVPAGGLVVVAVVLFVYKVMGWLRAPVPFRVPLTTGQQRSLRGLPRHGWQTPHSPSEVALRALVDIVLLRPLFRATPTALALGRGLPHNLARGLWLGAVAFHGAMAIVLLRHLRMVLEPVPGFVVWLEAYDVATEMSLPKLHVTSLLLLVALLFLLGRRLVLPRIRYISLAADYLPVLLLIAIAATGIVMRHVTRTDVTAVKELALGLVAGKLVAPAQVGFWLSAHVSCVAALLLYFPLGKLMHAPGVFLSPTLTLANTNRELRHLNPRNPKVVILHYTDYENTFRERMIEAGLPVEKQG
jgi:nitrate reductase gamma subunit